MAQSMAKRCLLLRLQNLFAMWGYILHFALAQNARNCEKSGKISLFFLNGIMSPNPDLSFVAMSIKRKIVFLENVSKMVH